MNNLHDSNDGRQFDPPLWSMGLAVLFVFAAPVMLYSLAPSGPLRAGDTIFSEGQQRVSMVLPAETSKPHALETCLLDPGNPLIILESPLERTDGEILATVQGSPAAEWPFCPPHTHVLVTHHQIFQKPDPWETPKRWLTDLFGK
jgi:hypothetical protein